MSLLHEIQMGLMQEDSAIGPIVLKLRYLASRLGSDVLEDWVRHEADGYPEAIAVPDYRKPGVSYSGTFSGAFGSGLNNAPIPPYLIEKFAGKKWIKYEIRHSISAVDDLIRASKGGSERLEIEASNLILVLQGKIYEHMACNSITGTISTGALVVLQFAVRNRMLDLTMELEKKIPVAAGIGIGPQSATLETGDSETVTHITNKVVYGNNTEIFSRGKSAQFTFNIEKGDAAAFVRALTGGGITDEDAKELVDIISEEEPESEEEPFGERAATWLGDNMKKAGNGSWKVGVSVATNLISEAAIRYYGLK